MGGKVTTPRRRGARRQQHESSVRRETATCALGPLASIAVARKSSGPSSIANAIGSQIINVLLGVGFPFLLYNLRVGKPILIDVSSRAARAGWPPPAPRSACSSSFFFVLCFRHVRPHAHASELRKPSLNDVGAVIVFALYGVSLVVLIVAER